MYLPMGQKYYKQFDPLCKRNQNNTFSNFLLCVSTLLKDLVRSNRSQHTKMKCPLFIPPWRVPLDGLIPFSSLVWNKEELSILKRIAVICFVRTQGSKLPKLVQFVTFVTKCAISVVRCSAILLWCLVRFCSELVFEYLGRTYLHVGNVQMLCTLS